MKKVTLFFAALAVTFSANALLTGTLDNPREKPFGATGPEFYNVKWDLDEDDWAATTLVEFDETFIFAIDISSLTDLKSWIAQDPTKRTVGVNLWSNIAGISGLQFRLEKIKGNIYGVTINFNQYALGKGKTISDALVPDKTFVLEGQIFGGSFTGEGLWYITSAGQDQVYEFSGAGKQIFSTLPYTGTKTSPAFANGDSNVTLYPDVPNDKTSDGYQKVEYYYNAIGITPIGEVTPDGKIVVGYYSILGVKLNEAPQKGIFIEKYSDGTSAKVAR